MKITKEPEYWLTEIHDSEVTIDMLLDIRREFVKQKVPRNVRKIINLYNCALDKEVQENCSLPIDGHLVGVNHLSTLELYLKN